jgi:Protein of unknown function (DUF4065)
MNQKLAELILFISEELARDRYPGFKIKLHKILCHADFAAYRARGESITGESYVHYENGPFLRAIDPTVNKLSQAGVARWAEPDQYNAIRLEAFRGSNVQGVCTEEEIRWVREAIDWARDREAEDVVLESHRWFGWVSTRNQETIPYSTSAVGDVRALSSDEAAWALDLITRYRAYKRQKAEHYP